MVDLKQLQKLSQDLSVLYVEDDLQIQHEMYEYMSKFFKKVVVAKDGVAGFNSYEKEEFDIVITDLSMPKMNGLEMLEKIKNINPNQVRLITSAHSESTYLINAIKIGIDGYIIKPFEYEQLNYELFKISEKIEKFKENEEYKRHLKLMVDQKTSELNSMIGFQKYNYDKTLLSMVEMIEDRDTYTAGHSQRVAHYSKIIAQEMGYSQEDCTKIYQAGILHDIGKIATPDVVLLNPQKLNDLEYKLIQEHVEVGYKLLANIPMFKEFASIVYAHHERFDGSGYPRGLVDEEIEPLAKIMAVADAFDAMTTNRIYKGRRDVAEAIEELVALQSIQFNPDVVQAAAKILQNVALDEEVDQLPRTDIEKERFAYFYNDILTNLYNQHYLEVVLVRNSYENRYKFMHIFELKRFSQYNKQFGWQKGDLVLKEVAEVIRSCAKSPKLFRVFGDDFILLDNEKDHKDTVKKALDSALAPYQLECDLKTFELSEVKINKVKDIEKII